MIQRTSLARQCLRGVSIGDAFGDSFFGETDVVLEHIAKRKIPETRWEFTDDTVMSIAVFEQLEFSGDINQDELARQFCINHHRDENRGYGATARRVLREIGEGKPWKEISSSVFEGMGSMGNGASMRANVIGAYYFDDFEKIRELAKASAEITHYNPEAIAGAIAVAIGTALATQMKLENKIFSPQEFIEAIVAELPDSDTRSKIAKSLTVPYSYSIETVKTILGNGINMTAQDTVPFALWCAAHNLENFEELLWKAVSILGDRDTICAIAGGIVIMSCREETIPLHWMKSVEDFNTSIFRSQT